MRRRRTATSARENASLHFAQISNSALFHSLILFFILLIRLRILQIGEAKAVMPSVVKLSEDSGENAWMLDAGEAYEGAQIL